MELDAYLSKGFWERFEDIAGHFPDIPVYSREGENLTYGEVLSRAEVLSGQLDKITHGIRGHVVEVNATLVPGSIVSFLAVLKSGAVILPVDPAFPGDFQREIRRQVSPIARLEAGNGPGDVFLCQDMIPGREEPPAPIAPEGAAVLLWTSGSTGKPKGILLPEQAFLLDAWNRIRDYHVRPGDRVAWTAPPVLAGPIGMLCFSLLGGATLVPFPLKSIDAGALSGLLRGERVSYFNPPVSYYRQWMLAGEGDGCLPDLRTVVLGGQPVSWKDVHALRGRLPEGAKLVHRYAATEAGLISQAFFGRLDVAGDEGSVPLGFPPMGKQTVILGEDGAFLQAGEVGEIGVVSRHGALGYWKRPDLDAERFRRLPGGETLFLTADLGRLRPDGQLELLGRRDGQLKVRGFRIEPAQVEAALRNLPGVVDAVLLPWTPPAFPDENELVAYVEPARGSRLAADGLRAGLQKSLPEFMLPSRFVLLEEMPRTRNGKPDRTRFPDPGTSRPELTVRFAPPQGKTEARLAALWQEVLGISPIGAEDDFFDLGGHSLSAVLLFSRIETVFGRDIPLAGLFQARTVRSMARLLEDPKGENEWRCLVRVNVAGNRPRVFFVHGGGGNVLCFARLAARLPAYDVYGLQALGLDRRHLPHLSVREMAERYAAEIRTEQPHGPFRIVGYSFGSVVAFELAVLLQASGEEVAFLGLLDRATPARSSAPPRGNLVSEIWDRGTTRLKFHLRLKAGRLLLGAGLPVPFMRKIYNVATTFMSRDYVPPAAFLGNMAVFQTEERRSEGVDPASEKGWGPHVKGETRVYPVPGTHHTLLEDPHVRDVARALEAALAEPFFGTLRTDASGKLKEI
jgi:acyl-coenzyme A synthetase/AMP-(fatty) acid ligase/thioesterase domain-containing protein/acyl carrier protein